MKYLLKLLTFCVCGISTAASAAIIYTANGGFEEDLGVTVGSGIGGFSQNVSGWFDENGGSKGDAIQWDQASGVPDDADGEVWGLLNINEATNDPGAFYQPIGTFSANKFAEVNLTVGDRDNFFFPSLELNLYSGNVTGADGSSLSSLGATLLDTYTITSAVFPLGDAADSSIPTQVVTLEKLYMNTGFAGTFGDTLWLEIRAVDPGGANWQYQALIDDVYISYTVPEPSSLGLLGLGLVLLRSARQKFCITRS